MKIIFLDFDGVITTHKSKWTLDKNKMKLIKKICDETDAKIVISSSWRRNTLHKTIDYITDINNDLVKTPFLIPDRVIGITPRMYCFKYPNNDNHYLCPRGIEIDMYIKEHITSIEKYVIIDDNSDMLLYQKPFFVKTNTLTGITGKEVNKAIKILK